MSVAESALGFAVGALVGLTGIGGGIVLTPVLLFLGVAPAVAVGTDLVYSGVTRVVGAWRHWQAGQVRWDWVLRTAAAAVPAAWAGSYLAWLLHRNGEAAEGVLRHLLGAVLVMAAALLVAAEVRRARRRGFPDVVSPLLEAWDQQGRAGDGQGRAGALVARLRAAAAAGRRQPGRLALPGAGALIGFLVGLTSVGSGALYTPVLLLFGRLAPAEVVGTDLAFGAVLATGAALAHGVAGTVDWGLAVRLLAGAVPGVLLGCRLAGAVPPRALRAGLVVCVLVSGLRLATV